MSQPISEKNLADYFTTRISEKKADYFTTQSDNNLWVKDESFVLILFDKKIHFK